MSTRHRTWRELVQQVEDEVCERGPSEIDGRKMRFLMAAYLRDIRNQLFRPAGVVAPPPKSAWDLDLDAAGEREDTPPFGFVDLRSVRKKTLPPSQRRPEDDAEPAEMEPARTESAGTDPAGTDPAGTDPAEMESAEMESAEMESAGMESAGMESAGMESAGMDAGDDSEADD